MMPKPKYIIGAGVLLVGLAGGGFFWSQASRSVQAVQVEIESDSAGPLDGLTFSGVIGSPTEPDRTKDRFVFSNGKFVSTECVRTCGYNAGRYFVREQDGKTEFLSVSHCTYKDAKIVWRGTVENGRLHGQSTWTVHRWYRTVEKKLLFEGKLTSIPKPIVSK